MTFSDKTLQVKPLLSANGNRSSASSKPRFRRRNLAALIASTIFLQACSSLPDQESVQGVNSGSDMSGVVSYSIGTSSRSSRNSTTPYLDSDSIPDGQNSTEPPQLVWQRISDGMQFANAHRNEEIQDQINWFIDNPDYIQQVTERSAPFIYEIVTEIERRGLPLELALLPMIESSYNPKARSSANAAGLWQFMARTASNFGLRRDFWYDGRQDPIASTHAALDYLERLHAQFDGDWLLALAAAC
jgi:membrane-bound lytic murein transglycosylase D